MNCHATTSSSFMSREFCVVAYEFAFKEPQIQSPNRLEQL